VAQHLHLVKVLLVVQVFYYLAIAHKQAVAVLLLLLVLTRLVAQILAEQVAQVEQLT
jgi:hypothetical protein